MAESDTPRLKQDRGVLHIEGSQFQVEPDGQAGWMITDLDVGRYVIQRAGLRKAMGENAGGLARCHIDVFVDFLVGIHQRRWSGVVAVDTMQGVKKIYFEDGEIICWF